MCQEGDIKPRPDQIEKNSRYPAARSNAGELLELLAVECSRVSNKQTQNVFFFSSSNCCFIFREKKHKFHKIVYFL